jgi:hypothetical protein
MVIHGTWLTPVHVQPFCALTAIELAPPAAGTDRAAGSRLNPQAVGAPPWLIVTACPATVSAAVRTSPVFRSTRTRTVPDPLTFGTAVTTTHGAPPDAVQPQPSSVSTLSVPSPPMSSKDRAVGDTVNWQGAAACWISARAVPTSSIPRRIVGTGLLPAA